MATIIRLIKEDQSKLGLGNKKSSMSKELEEAILLGKGHIECNCRIPRSILTKQIVTLNC